MYRDYINRLREEFIGKKIEFNGYIYTVAYVDYNGIIHIDLPSKHNNTTAVYDSYEAREHLI